MAKSATRPPRLPAGHLPPDLILPDIREVTELAERLLGLAGIVTCLLKSSSLLPPSSLPATEGRTVADTLASFDATAEQFVDRLAGKASVLAAVATGEPVQGIHAATAHHAVQEYARTFRDQLSQLAGIVSGRLAEILDGIPAEDFRQLWPAVVDHCRRVPAYLDQFSDDTSSLMAAVQREGFLASQKRGERKLSARVNTDAKEKAQLLRDLQFRIKEMHTPGDSHGDTAERAAKDKRVKMLASATGKTIDDSFVKSCLSSITNRANRARKKRRGND